MSDLQRGLVAQLAASLLIIMVLQQMAVAQTGNKTPAASVDSDAQSSAEFPSTTLFKAESEGYRVYRIPALIKAGNGDLLAFCEAREGGDASEIDMVMKRSTDQGRTWGPLRVVQASADFKKYFADDPPPITIGNPAPVVDRLDPDHPDRIWMPFTLENDRVFVTYSDDHGANWSDPREITDDVKKEPWGWYATGPVHSIQIQKGPYRGRLVVPADHRLGPDGSDSGPEGAQVLLSDDHGSTWRLGAVDETYEDGLNANETTVTELADGTLLFSTRDQNGSAAGTRGEAWSKDGGETFDSGDANWKSFRPASAVIDPPVVQGALLSVADDLVLFSGPDESGPSGTGRTDMRIRYSQDNASTWHDGPLIHQGPAAYSDMVAVSDERIGMVFEAGDPGQKSPYQRIVFVTVDRDQILRGQEK